MTRALWTFLGRGFLVLALCGTAVGCGDDDDDDDATKDAGPKGGSGAKGGTGGKSGGSGGGGGTVSKAECVKIATEASKALKVSAACLDCGCGSAAKVISECNAACWALIGCATAKCADKLADKAAGDECVGMMCTDFIGTEGPLAGSLNAAMAGPALSSETCAKACAPPPPVPPTGDGGVDDGGVDGGS